MNSFILNPDLQSAAMSIEIPTNSSEDLISRVRGGDEEAFRLVFERYARSVFRFIYGMVGATDLASELMQETFVRVYDNRNKLREDSKLGSWIFGIARNVVLNALRSRRVAADKLASGTYVEIEASGRGASPDDRLLDKELNRVIGDALTALTEDKRVVFTLKVLQQKSYEEISEITGHSIAKLKTDLHRAKAEMRTRIRPYVENSHEL